MNTYLLNIGLLTIFFGLVFYASRRRARAEVEWKAWAGSKDRKALFLSH